MSKKAELLNIQNLIVKEYGEIFFDIDKLREEKLQIIPVSLGLDIALGGGWEEGNIGTVAGLSGSGKTTYCLTLAAAAQKCGKKVYWFDAENRLKLSLLKTIDGLSTEKDKWEVVKSTKDKLLTAEDIFNIMISLLEKEENILIILDSIAALCPENLRDQKIGDSRQMGGPAKITYDLMRKVSQIVRLKRSLLVGITHVQANLSGYGSPHKDVGGNAWQYFSSYKLMCTKTSEVPSAGTADEKKTGRESIFKITKSALSAGTGSGMFPIRYGRGYDKYGDIAKLAIDLAMIDAKGAWLNYTFEGEEVKIQGVEKLIKHLSKTPKHAEYFESKIRELALAAESTDDE